MNRKSAILLILSLLHFFRIAAQIAFSGLPMDYQMFPRENRNYGELHYSVAAANNCTLESILTEMISMDTIETFTCEPAKGIPFGVEHKVPARLKEYELNIYVSEPGHSKKHVVQRSALLAGDFFIVNGQSNAECPPSAGVEQHDSLFRNQFTRVIGANFSWATGYHKDSTIRMTIEEDCRFARPASWPYLMAGFGYSGIWPVRLQSELANSTGIPNCFVNGSKGASPIAEHYATHTPSVYDSLRYSGNIGLKTTASIYDRIYKKLYANHAVSGVKGIFWYQGESDGVFDRDSCARYDRRFDRLYRSWKSDYPGLERIFVLQINLGCGGQYHNLIREIQRKLPQTYADVTVMSTVGSPVQDRSNDGCHYSVLGYSNIASKLVPLVEKHLYGIGRDDRYIMPPDIVSAYYTNDVQLCLEFDKDVMIQQSCSYGPGGGNIAYLKNYFYDQAGVKINAVSLSCENNRVFLDLAAEQALVRSVTYLPAAQTDIPSIYAGPWILNKLNDQLGAYSFLDFPVKLPETPENIRVFPNPANNRIKIIYGEKKPEGVVLYDVYGKSVISVPAHDYETTLDISALPQGIYLLKAIGGAVPETIKIVVK